MLSVSTTRQPAPILACGAVWLRPSVGPAVLNWKGVAASAAGAAVGTAVGAAVQGSGVFKGLGDFSGIAQRTASSFAAGVTTAALRGGRVATTQIALDVFGNALGESIAHADWSGASQQNGMAFLNGPNQSAAETARLNSYEGRAAAQSGLSLSGASEYRLQTGQSFSDAYGPVSSFEPTAQSTQGRDQNGRLYGTFPGGSWREVGPELPLTREQQYALAWGGGPRTPESAAAYVLDREDGVARLLDRGDSPSSGSAQAAVGQLPEIELQRRYSGATTQAVSMGWAEAFNSNNSIGERLVFGGLALAGTPNMLVESLFYAPFNFEPAAKEFGQHLARANLQSDPAERNLDLLRATSAGTEAFTNAGAWLVGSRPQGGPVYGGGFAANEALARAAAVGGSELAARELAALGPNTQLTLRAYQRAYDDAAVAFWDDFTAGSIKPPPNLNFNTWAGGQIDNAARAEMNAFKRLNSLDDLVVNRRLDTSGGFKNYRLPDLLVRGERTAIDGTIGTKGLTTPQIHDIFMSGRVDRMILVSPNRTPTILTIEQFLAHKR